MRQVTGILGAGILGAAVLGAAMLAGCTTQTASPPPTATPPAAAASAPIEFRVVPERNPAGCRRFDTSLSRVHTFQATGDGATVTSAGGVSSTMTRTAPGIYTTEASLGSTTLRVVADAASTPKSLTVSEPRLGCRWTAIAP